MSSENFLHTCTLNCLGEFTRTNLCACCFLAGTGGRRERGKEKEQVSHVIFKKSVGNTKLEMRNIINNIIELFK